MLNTPMVGILVGILWAIIWGCGDNFVPFSYNTGHLAFPSHTIGSKYDTGNMGQLCGHVIHLDSLDVLVVDDIQSSMLLLLF